MFHNSICYYIRNKQTYRTSTILSITRMITDRIELHSVLLPLLNQMRVVHIKSTIKAQEALNTGVESVKQSALLNGGIVMEE